MNVDPTILGLGGIGLVALGVAVMLGLSLRDPNSLLLRNWRRYVGRFDVSIGLLYLETTGPKVALIHIVSLVASIGVLVYSRDPRALILVALALFGPNFYFYNARRQRSKRINLQIDGWLLMLANMLRATSALADAIKSTADLVRNPIRQELDLVVKEVEVGSNIEDSLRSMAERVGSENLTTVVGIISVARSTGGELPKLLESTASAMREMERVEGVLRAKTSQAKFQLYTLIAAPLLIIYGLIQIEEHYFDPLLGDIVGWTILGIAIVLWVLSIAMARKILSVQL